MDNDNNDYVKYHENISPEHPSVDNAEDVANDNPETNEDNNNQDKISPEQPSVDNAEEVVNEDPETINEESFDNEYVSEEEEAPSRTCWSCCCGGLWRILTGRNKIESSLTTPLLENTD